MERGRSRHRRGGGGRRRPWGERGGHAHSSRGYREENRDQVETSVSRNEDRNEAAEAPNEDKVASSGFSKRKITSNWERYEEAEKESESETKVLQRGEDYNVLLSSAGDAFAQFRFADEREWGTENSNYKQALAASLDPQCLARVLQELPLYLRLNVEPELVQEDLPQELPPFNTKRVSEMPTAINNKCTGATGGSTQMQILPMGNTTKTFNESQSLALDEELDFLLNLESPSKETDSQTISQHEEVKLQVKSEDPPVTNDVELSTVEKNKTLSSEDLEDWLDSMIS